VSRSRPWPTVREDDIQASLVAHLHWRGVPGLFFFHSANEGRRHPIEGARLKAVGLRAGTPDVILIH
jgi:hypothetical protein